ncbi:MAG: ferredoxin family protein [Candidatus Methanofastidiosia archaeon]
MREIIIDEKCIGCGKCIEICYKGPRIYKLVKVKGERRCVVIDASWCMECTNCLLSCPVNAIKIRRKMYED